MSDCIENAVTPHLRFRDLAGVLFEGPIVQTGFEESGVALTAEFQSSRTPLVEVSCELDLELCINNGREVRAPGRVFFQGRKDEICSVEFLVGLAARLFIAPALNCREAIRVDVCPRVPVEVHVKLPGGKTLRPFVRDVSASGMALLFKKEDERLLSREWTLEFSLLIPGWDAPVRMSSDVCYRRLVDGHILYGVHFDPEATMDFDCKRKAILRYVMKRQIEVVGELRLASAQQVP